MAKTVSLDDMTHAQLVVLAGRLTMLAMKPVPLGIAANYAIGLTEIILGRASEEQMKRLGAVLGEMDFQAMEKGGDKLYRLMMGRASTE